MHKITCYWYPFTYGSH